MHFELSPLMVCIALWKVNTYSKFQVNILSNHRDYKLSKFLHKAYDKEAVDDAKAIAITPVFSENNRVKKEK